MLTKFKEVYSVPLAVAAGRGVIISPPVFPVPAIGKYIVFCFNFPRQRFVPQAFSRCVYIVRSHSPSTCRLVTRALFVGDTQMDRCSMSHNKDRGKILMLNKQDALLKG